MRSDGRKARLSAGTVASIIAVASTAALAQEADRESGLDVIVVTAQKRVQDVQDVPIAVTAIGAEALAANRVVDVTDLSSIAPGVTVRVSAGGSQLPSFTVRGAVSYGVVPGSDKQVSVYLDGVYISSPRGSIFDLPDVERIEMLRGPQGTLFGRNATAGAVSISTREPMGEARVRAGASIGNQDSWRFKLSMDTPQFGPFSAYASFVHNYRRGDIRNAREGQVWDRSAATTKLGRARSPRWLGTKEGDSYFVAVKFAPSDNFTSVYKYDRFDGGNITPEGTGFVGLNAAAPLVGNLFATLVSSQSIPVNQAPDGKRPDVVDNSFAVPTDQKNQGHSLTSTLELGGITLKNIAAYRKSYIFAAQPIEGFGALPFTQQTLVPYATFVAFSTLPPAQAVGAIPTIAAQLQPLVGQPFSGIGIQSEVHSKQWSDELQLNYDSDFLTLTAGALYFKSEDYNNKGGLAGSVAFTPVFGGIIPARLGVTFNKAESIAAYAQAEFHLSPALDLVAGGRLTQDKKSGSLTFNFTGTPETISFKYKDTRPTYLVGVNFRPTEDILTYVKYSTAFVSGGSVSGIPFAPEKAKSLEGGVKASLLNRRLITSLSLFWAKYKNYQSAQGASTFGPLIDELTGDPRLASIIPTFVLSQGDVEAKGFEFELTAAPTQGVTAGGSLSYTKTDFSNVPGILLASLGMTDESQFAGTYRPKWTASVFAQYETQPLFGDAYLSVRADGAYQSRMLTDANQNRGVAAFEVLRSVKPYWIVNGRAALRDIDFGGVKAEVALWGKNIFDEDEVTFALVNANLLGSANYIQGRSYGVDLNIEF